MNLVIVESPTKAKTISHFLDKNYKITSSFGHIRDLPKTKLGVDVDNNFKPNYTIPVKARERVNAIAALAKKAKKIYYATDEDREGEAISWHLSQILKRKYKIKTESFRITFHEITKEAILDALKNPRSINKKLVDAQQARRILDRLVGYKLSPFLWKKIMRGLSAGRVQSVAVRLIVEREKEIKKFKPQEYWSVTGVFDKTASKTQKFEAVLCKLNDKKIAKFDLNSQKQIKKISNDLKKLDYSVSDVTKKDTKKNPYPPYKTSTLQQDAHTKLGFSSKQTMLIAQQLYEGKKLGSQGTKGLITYMRTDSLIMSNKFIAQTKKFLTQTYGDKYSFRKARVFKNKTKGAQEAHEAIRPTDVYLEPKDIKPYLDARQLKLYELIWKRSVASLMPQAIISHKKVEILGEQHGNSTNAHFQTSTQIVKFDGFLKVYRTKIDSKTLPDLIKQDQLNLQKISPKQHFTEPPPRYNDASLVKELEKQGIGRPSTYAPIIDTVQKRQYVEKDDSKRFKPTDIGELVTELLAKHFPNIVDYEFTAKMENDLDEIAADKKKWTDTVGEFYGPFAKTLKEKYEKVKKVKLKEEVTKKTCPECKAAKLIVKRGRFGKFLACPKFPDCKHTEPLSANASKDEKAATSKKKAPLCDKCKSKMIVKEGRFGKFWACPDYPECKSTKRIEIKINFKCPKCKNGDVIVQRTRNGKTFFGCNKFPDCKYASWKNPTIPEKKSPKNKKS